MIDSFQSALGAVVEYLNSLTEDEIEDGWEDLKEEIERQVFGK